ncbi:MAG: hypothetical protein AAGD35_22865 [Actinomycetota bacterium]
MILYVSWGGSGRAASVRAAMRRAVGADDAGGRGLRYLAVLDDAHFADLDGDMLAVVTDELRWLLDAQLELTKEQLGADDLLLEVVVRRGDVVEAVVDVLGERGPAEVLIGAPVSLSGHGSIDDLRRALSERIGADVAVVEPEDVDAD